MASQIEHTGVVERTDRERVYVKITSRSACGSCQARQACGLAESQDKIVEVQTPGAAQYAPGDTVMVGISRHAGSMAVFYAYVLALVVLVAVLILALEVLGWSEGPAALFSLGGVVAYYAVLWLCRDKLEDKIKITITKI